MSIINIILKNTIYSAALVIVIVIILKYCSEHIYPYIKYIAWGLLLTGLTLPITFIGVYIIQNDKLFISEGWDMVVISIWLLGVLISLIHIFLLSVRLKSYIYKTRLVTPDWILNIMEDCKLKLGIRRNISINVKNSIYSPALTTTLRPCILIPEYLVNEEHSENIRFALLHELTHYKRRDHITYLLLLFLSLINWFNPILYFAIKNIKQGLETACDCEVVKYFNAEERQGYIVTIIELLSKNTQPQPLLGMLSNQTRKNVEKRIRAIYSKRKA